MTVTSSDVTHDVTDIALTPEGIRRIEWAEREMPVLRLIRERTLELLRTAPRADEQEHEEKRKRSQSGRDPDQDVCHGLRRRRWLGARTVVAKDAGLYALQPVKHARGDARGGRIFRQPCGFARLRAGRAFATIRRPVGRAQRGLADRCRVKRDFSEVHAHR